MPAQSKQQQKFMGMVHALQKGDMKPSDASASLKKVAQSMKKSDAKDFASTKHKGLPRKVKQEILNRLKEYANKMGTDHLGGDDYTSSKKGGLRDFDGYDNVDYNKDMPMDEVSSADAYKISRMLGTAQQSTQDFIEDNKIDVKKLESYIKSLSPAKKGIIKDIIHGSTDKRLSGIKKNLIKQIGESKGVPQNYMQGRTSDYHTALRGKNRDYSGGTNFKKTNHGQPDLENDDEDQETNQLNNKQTSLKAESFDKVEHLKLLNLALRAMPGSQKQKEIIRKLNQVRKAGGMRPLKETSIIEYGQRLDLSFIEDEDARLDGTPKPKDAINRDLDEGTMIRRAVDLAQEILPKNTWSRYASDGNKNKEFVKSIVRDLAQLLNKFYKSHDVDVRIKEEVKKK